MTFRRALLAPLLSTMLPAQQHGIEWRTDLAAARQQAAAAHAPLLVVFRCEA